METILDFEPCVVTKHEISESREHTNVNLKHKMIHCTKDEIRCGQQTHCEIKEEQRRKK